MPRNATQFSLVGDEDEGYETQWENGLVIDGVEILEIDEDNINQQLAAIYELTYKYDAIDLHKWDGDVPKDDILAITEAGIRDVAGRLAEMLIEVFDNWLASHAITDPKKWGQARAETIEDHSYEGNMIEEVVDQFSSSMAAQDGRLWGEGARKYYRNMFFSELPDHVEEMPVLKRLAEPLLDEIHEQNMNDYIEEGEIGEEPEKPEIYEIFDLEFLEWAKNLEHDQLMELVAELLSVMVFPAWYGHWKAEGIDDTRKRVEKAYKDLKKIDSNQKAIPVRDLATRMNIIINTAHQTGSMTDYVEDRWNLDYNILDELSNYLDTDQLDWALRPMGVQEEADASAAERRRTSTEAAKIVRSAWADLAKYERMGNPRFSLQEAVIQALEEE